MIVLWRVSNHCNLACPFCAYDKRLGLPREEADPGRVARFIELLGAWRGATGQPVLLSWLGGEPLLWAPRAELDARAAEQGVDLSLTTNGTRLGAPQVRAELVRRYREVTISIDGMADFHDAMRGWRGAFAKLAQTVPALVAERDAAGAQGPGQYSADARQYRRLRSAMPHASRLGSRRDQLQSAGRARPARILSQPSPAP
jgi:MoaA/NifB/PqqE/SkfB family radical SAM enzyme